MGRRYFLMQKSTIFTSKNNVAPIDFLFARLSSVAKNSAYYASIVTKNALNRVLQRQTLFKTIKIPQGNFGNLRQGFLRKKGLMRRYEGIWKGN